MRTRPAALLLVILLMAGCPGGPRPDTGPRARPGPPADAEEKAERHLQAAERHVARHSRDPKAWKSLLRAAGKAAQPHRYLLALERAHARGRLPASLRGDLANRLFSRARSLSRLGAPFWYRKADLLSTQWQGAPAAALRTLRRARALRPATGKDRHRHAALEDRLRLQLADGLLYTGQPEKARKTYFALRNRGVLDGEALHWRLAAVGASKEPLAQTAALARLAKHAPAAARDLVHSVLSKPSGTVLTLLNALRVASLGTDRRLMHRIETQLVKVAPAPMLARACALRQRPGSPTCRTLQRWAMGNLTALRQWARLCRRLHWAPGDARWLAKVITALRTHFTLGLGPLEGLVSKSLARRTAKTLPREPALARLGGSSPGASRAQPSTSGPDTAQRAFEAWAAGRSAVATAVLAKATARVQQAGKTASFAERCRLLRLTRLVQGRAAAFRLMKQLAQQDSRYASHLTKRLLARNDHVAVRSMAVDRPAADVLHRQKEIGLRLARYGATDTTALLKHWTQRYGKALAARSWATVVEGTRSGVSPDPRKSSTDERLHPERIWLLAGQGHLATAETYARKFQRRSGLPGCWHLWLARIPHLQGRKGRAQRRLRQYLHTFGFGALPKTLSELVRLGFHQAAGRLANDLYERDLTDPALLRVMARGSIATGKLDKAGLIITDWASQTGRPDSVYLTVARWLAARKKYRAAATYANKAIGWRGDRPLEATLQMLGYLWVDNRHVQASRSVRWLLQRWPAGNGRKGVSQAIAGALLAADMPKRALPFMTRQRGLELPALLRARRYKALETHVIAMMKRDPLNPAWPALSALAAMQQRQWKHAAERVEQVGRRAPSLEPPLLAMLLAARGRLKAALAMLAQAHARSWGNTPITLLAAALASRAGNRKLAARILADVIPFRNACLNGVDTEIFRLVERLVKGKPLPLRIPWAMLLGADSDPGSCEP